MAYIAISDSLSLSVENHLLTRDTHLMDVDRLFDLGRGRLGFVCIGFLHPCLCFVPSVCQSYETMVCFNVMKLMI